MDDEPEILEDVEKYSIFTVFAHWVLIISILGLILTGGLPLLNALFDLFNVLSLSVPEIPNSAMIHNIFGFVLIFGILFVAFTHTMNFREILGERKTNDLSAFIRSFTYIIGLESRLESGGGNKFYSYQKVSFVIVLFSLWMIIFSGILLFVNSPLDNAVSRAFMGNIGLLHRIGAVLISLFLLYHLIMIIRRMDKHSLKCMLINGKVPAWYVKKNHKIWFDELTRLEE